MGNEPMKYFSHEAKIIFKLILKFWLEQKVKNMYFFLSIMAHLTDYLNSHFLYLFERVCTHCN